MQTMVIATASALWTVGSARKSLPDPVPKPPGRAPGEPIIIKDPTRPLEVPETDGPLDEEDEPEIRKPPGIIPETPPPPQPWERAKDPSGAASAVAR
jgi:hypothetical protein